MQNRVTREIWPNPMSKFPYHRDEQDTIREPAQHLEPAVPVRKVLGGLGPDGDRGVEPNDQRGAVEEHVEGVADEHHAVAPDPGQELHIHEHEVDAEEIEDLARLRVVLHALQDGGHAFHDRPEDVVTTSDCKHQSAGGTWEDHGM